MVIHKIKKQRPFSDWQLANKDDTWNVLCLNKGKSRCAGSWYWNLVTCKKCLKLRKSTIKSKED